MTYTITLTNQEAQNGELHPNTLKIAKHLFSVHGFLKIENLFPPAFIETLATAYRDNIPLESGTEASHRRHIVPIPFTSPFNDPMLYANPILLPILEALLGPNCILNTLGSITALPGCTDQHLHADHIPLFEENLTLSNQIPPFAITVGVPLLDIDLLNGPTKIWSGSHLTYPIDQNMTAYPKHFLHGPKGSCYFWDYRTFHAGGSNHSEEVRSLLYLAYTRRWFKDVLNPDLLKMERKAFDEVPAKHKKLFAHKFK